MYVLSPELIRKVDCRIDELHDQFVHLGARFFDSFGSDRGKISTQVRNLQQIACSAVRFADIEDFVKNQMGKKDKQEWKAVGDEALKQLSQLRSYSEEVASDASDRMAVRQRLARGWVRAVVGEYLYRLAHLQMENSP